MEVQGNTNPNVSRQWQWEVYIYSQFQKLQVLWLILCDSLSPYSTFSYTDMFDIFFSDKTCVYNILTSPQYVSTRTVRE